MVHLFPFKLKLCNFDNDGGQRKKIKRKTQINSGYKFNNKFKGLRQVVAY